ncbi:3-hydroxyacyl-CoA dehydrogenase NAD-binding domain-containing protein [Maritimibacter sp. DP1N21-5]|uniref:3-hydroxyacyl-CoA dehydrogenase NAD-binding domain-containing protein n=1 Tax=Maritimibacter sp. DP1N21-5 TaxID=2836867 RepID=UPI001C497068|nr:3-hydroxyacyl-CoA dehydrogenase NAD-binding domain-containing protein [Maritimibacter sp. DP1N21-5]MBV7410338.1 enoyl-CoA hydratase/isomerase family protein [Maritimibacter sp. DP1N21-5]
MNDGPADKVRIETRDGVMVVTVDNVPVNALVQPVRKALLQAVVAAEANPEVRAIVIGAAGKTFPAGADVREFTVAAARPTLSELCDRIEACTKPVVAAIHGTALGGGFELALACHYRLALPDAHFGFPEITLGLVPTAGGTQRLPRIAGARAALDLLVSGRPIDAMRAQALGLVDKVVNRGLERAAFGTARNMGEEGTAPRPTRKIMRGLDDPARYLELVSARRKMLPDRSVAIERAIDLVESALLLPFEAGLMRERVAYEDLVNTDEAQGLRHAFLAERRAGREARFAGVAPRPIAGIGVVGAGPLARDIAIAALATGVPVRLALEDDGAIGRARARIEAVLAQAVETGRMTGRDRDARLMHLTVSDSYRVLADSDVIIEALAENAVRKAATLTRLSQVVMTDAVVASSTADCDIPTLARAVSHPERFAAMHFVAPADRNRLVEVAGVPETRPDAIVTLLGLARSMGKVPVTVAPRIGLIVNAMMQAYYTAACLTLEQGAMPAEVDAALRSFGMPLGPLQAQDMAGLDSVWGLAAEDCASAIPLRMIENAWYGSRSGQGFYRYDEGEKGGRAAPEVFAMIRDLRESAGIVARAFEPEEIQQRCLRAMANEGARLIASGTATRPSDVDAAMLLALGFPRTAGGPMALADREGAVAVRKALVAWEAESDFWTPEPIWQELIKIGGSFGKMNAR